MKFISRWASPQHGGKPIAAIVELGQDNPALAEAVERVEDELHRLALEAFRTKPDGVKRMGDAIEIHVDSLALTFDADQSPAYLEGLMRQAIDKFIAAARLYESKGRIRDVHHLRGVANMLESMLDGNEPQCFLPMPEGE